MGLFPEYEPMIKLAMDVLNDKAENDETFRKRFWGGIAVPWRCCLGAKLPKTGLPDDELLTTSGDELMQEQTEKGTK